MRVSIDPKSGEYETFQRWTVVDALPEVGEMDEESGLYAEGMILLEDAQQRKPEAVLGDHIEEPMTSLAFGRIAAQTAVWAAIRPNAKDVMGSSMWSPRTASGFLC